MFTSSVLHALAHRQPQQGSLERSLGGLKLSRGGTELRLGLQRLALCCGCCLLQRLHLLPAAVEPTPVPSCISRKSDSYCMDSRKQGFVQPSRVHCRSSRVRGGGLLRCRRVCCEAGLQLGDLRLCCMQLPRQLLRFA
jgi:hypothetical protein